MTSLWKFLTSLRLTIVLLALAIVLVFVGTVAQADEGLYQVQNRYFRHWFILGTTLFGYHMPWFIWPGGYTIGFSLLTNLVAAHIKRFHWSSAKIGIHLTHLGIIILLVGQLATDMLQVESRMTFNEGQSANFVEHHSNHELVFSTDAGGNDEKVVSIPEELVTKGAAITNPNLPFNVQVKEYSPNSDMVVHSEVTDAATKLTTALATVEGEFSTPDALVPQAERAAQSEGRVQVWRDALKAIGEPDTDDIVAATKKVAAQPDKEGKLREILKKSFRTQMLQRFTMQGGAMKIAADKIGAGQPITEDSLPAAAPNGAGAKVAITPLPEAKDMDTRNLPYALIELDAPGKNLGTWLVTPQLKPQDVTVDGKAYHIAFREERNYLPYSFTLMQATHKKYAGSDTPKDFRSRVLIENPDTKEHREVEISMNNPLRYKGLAFFQYQMTKDELDRSPGQSVLQVVHNPSWLAPYIGCIVVAVGMLWQFLHHLVGFITKRRPA
jgi:hypothetical protein